MIITIDGPTGTGKSTIAKRLAQSIGYIFFDTGAMYRCLTYAILKHNISIDDAAALDSFLNDFKFEYKILRGERTYYVDGEDVTLKIRGPEVTSYVSKVAAIPAVRKKLVALQQSLSEGVNAVFEGRDMGSVVFPNAQLKIFLTGHPEVRAQRRFAELNQKFPESAGTLKFEDVLADMLARDEFDSNRTTSPLKQADDAFVIDTSDMAPDEVILKILECKDSLKKRHISSP
jgi:cytidylate kinase